MGGAAGRYGVTTMVTEVYEALLEGGTSPDKAIRAATVLAERGGDLIELRGEVAQLRGEVTKMDARLSGEVAQLRGDLVQLRGEVSKMDTRLSERLASVEARMGILITLGVAMFVVMLGGFARLILH